MNSFIHPADVYRICSVCQTVVLVFEYMNVWVDGWLDKKQGEKQQSNE